MRKLKVEKNLKIDNEAVVKVEIDKISGGTSITVASGYLDGSEFVPVEEGKRSYKINGATEEMPETDYFAEVDKQNSPSLAYYGLLYRAKQEGVFILYSAAESLSVSVLNTTITVSLEPLVTTNHEIITAINANLDALALIYSPEAIDLSADVDTPGVAQEIK